MVDPTGSAVNAAKLSNLISERGNEQPHNQQKHSGLHASNWSNLGFEVKGLARHPQAHALKKINRQALDPRKSEKSAGVTTNGPS